MLLRAPPVVDGSLPRDELEKHDPEAVDIGFDGELARPLVLRGAVAVRPHDPGGHVRLVPDRSQLCQPEIGEFGIVVLVEQDVGRLQVAVNHGRVGLIVQILQPFGSV